MPQSQAIAATALAGPFPLELAAPLAERSAPGGVEAGAAAHGSWHALWTRSHCEKLVHEQLESKGFHPFLPLLHTWSSRGGRPHQIGLPMFPGYLFLHDSLGKAAYIEVRKARGLVALLGQGWDRLAVIPHAEMAAIQLLQSAAVEVKAHPFLHEGQRVRVIQGPLTGVEGTLVKIKANRGRLVLSIGLLQRSVSTEVDTSAVAAA